MRAVITVIGKDAVGIIAAVSQKCLEHHVNIEDITQKVMEDMFVMIMIVDISNLNEQFTAFVDEMDELGKQRSLSIHTMHEDIFDAMHNI